MDRLLLNYLPNILRNVPNLKALMAAEQPEVELLWGTLGDVLENQFLVSATEYGIKRWERMLQIYPKDTDGLEMRRACVLAILQMKLPYTTQWLRQWLDGLCGEGNCRLEIVNYTVSLNLQCDTIPEAEKLVKNIVVMLRAIMPAHLRLEIGMEAIRSNKRMRLAGGLGCITSTRLPAWEMKYTFEEQLRVGAAIGCVNETMLEQIEE